MQTLEEAIPSEISQLDDVRSRVAIPCRIIDMDSLLSTSRITTPREQRPYGHLDTLTVLCVITVLAFIVYSLKCYTRKMNSLCMTRQNTYRTPQNRTLFTKIPSQTAMKIHQTLKATKDMLYFPFIQTNLHRASLCNGSQFRFGREENAGSIH